MTVKHTPEPWRYDSEDFAVWAQSGGEECCVADLDSLPFNSVNTEEEQHANGDLIAAAPSLADRLEARACCAVECEAPCDACRADREVLRAAGRLP
jgi:hypothetical protein